MFSWLKKNQSASAQTPTAFATDDSTSHKKRGDQYFDEGKLIEAVSSYRRAIEINPAFAEAFNNLGNVFREQGLADEAEHCLKQAILFKPELTNAYCNLGSLLLKNGKPSEAVTHLSRALELKPDAEVLYVDLALALVQTDKFEAAKQVILKGITFYPNFADFHSFLGNIHLHDHELEQAVACYQNTLAIRPDDSAVLSNLGKVFLAQGKLNAALNCSRKVMELNHNLMDLQFSLGLAFQQQKDLSNAIMCYREILEKNPDLIEVHVNLGNLLTEQGKPVEAIASYQQALSINPDFIEAHNNLGRIYTDQGQPDKAIACYQQALAINPDFAEGYNNLGNIFREHSRSDEAIASYRKALSLKPDYIEVHGNLLITMQYSATLTPAEIYAEHLCFAEKFETPLKSLWQKHANLPDPHKRLKVGYVSPDFRSHSVAYFVEPILSQHNKSQVEVFCYYNNLVHDRFTDRIKSHADHWVPCMAMSDQQLTERIRADGIDILVDLAGHFAHNRLFTFARKPAPVQISYIGYPTTTGMAAIDYRITDEYADPSGMTERFNVERLYRLPEIYCCYQEHVNTPEVIDHPPAEANGYITFGCLNNFAKVTDKVLSVWAKILEKVPSSRLMMKIKGIDSPNFRADIENRFEIMGIPATRLILTGFQNENPFNLYNSIDITFDPFPYNGCTTSMDTLWMGVPFITLAGNNSLSRIGVTILSNAGLPELIADTEESYIDIATTLALDIPKLKSLRSGLRERIKQSPLMNAPQLTQHLENAYREMWQAWCMSNISSEEHK